MNALQQIAQHIPVMQALRTQLLAATTPKQVQDAQAALETEQVWATNMNGQIQASALMYAAQRDANEERQNQRLDQSIDNALNQAKTRGYWQ
jgi:preprotein translocase subunit Sec63